MQGLENLRNGEGPINVVERTSVSVSTIRPTHAGGASKQSRRQSKKDADEIKEKSLHIADRRTKNATRLPKRAVSKAAATLVIGQSTSACASPTTSLTAVAAM